MSNSSKAKKLLKNEWIRTGILLAIVVIAFFSLWYGIRIALATDYPLLAVASGSMEPTLNVGDLIIVHGVSNASEIYTHFAIVDNQTGNIIGGGDIIVFHEPGDPDVLIVHRAVNKTLDTTTGVWYFTTKGDNNPFPGQYRQSAESRITDGWSVPFSYIVGKVVGTVPYVGNIPLFIRTPTGIVTIVILIILVLFVEMAYSSFKEKRTPQTEAQS
jgi:signal peptidase